MYISVFIWLMVVNPLIDWMLRNKVYAAKGIPEKIKKDWFFLFLQLYAIFIFHERYFNQQILHHS